MFDRPTRRLVQLQLGLVVYGASLACMVRAQLGLDPWDTFHQGVAERSGLSFGTVVIVVGASVLALWIPLRQRPGIGTVSNILVIGLAADAVLSVLATPDALGARWALMLTGIAANAVATGAYIGAGLGPGPRDGLMTGLVARTGLDVARVRAAIELTVLAAGWALGGTVGVGTVLYAVGIGPLVARTLPRLTIGPPRRPVPASLAATGRP